MKPLICFALAGLCVVGAVGAYLASTQEGMQAPAVAEDAGTLHLTGKDGTGGPGGKSCTISIEKGKTSIYMGDTACKNDEVYFYRFSDAKSGSLISFDAEDDCKTDSSEGSGDWIFTIRTFEDSTTGWNNLNDLQNMKDRTVIDDGIWLESGHYHKGSIGGKLSCVIIER